MYIPFKQCVHLNGGQPFKGVIHIGAHHGQEGPQYLESGVQKVIWVEACRTFMAELYDRTMALNGLRQYYVNNCFSDIDGEKVLFNVANNGQSSSMLALGTHATMYPHIKYVDSVEMETKRFDTFMKENERLYHFNDYDFVNLDVQGAELKVLKGFGSYLTLPNIRAIYTEVNFEHVYKGCCLIGELDEFLESFGFTRALTAAPERTWGDALYLRLP